MNEVAKLLTAAKKLIEKPEHWTKGWFAKDERGTDTNCYSPSAVRFCSWGALRRAGCETLTQATEQLRLAMDIDIPPDGEVIACFNDSHTHEEVLAAFDRAIVRAAALS